MNIIKKDEKFTEVMLEGIIEMADIVTRTMGPGGNNVALMDEYGNVKVTKDGVTVAKSVVFDDPVKDIGARLLREAAQKTCDDSGDGTTTTILLASEMVRSGMGLIDEVFASDLKNQMHEAASMIIETMKEIVVPCNDEKMMKHVAMVSSNGDEEISDLVVEAMVKATKDGAVSIEASQSGKSYVETISGMRFERGFESNYFINDDGMKTCTFDAPNILIIRGKVDNMVEFIKVLEPSINIGRPLVIMADDFSMDIINALAVNKVQNGFKLCAVKLPSFDEQRDAMVNDLEHLLGAVAVGTPSYPFDKFDPEINLGSCERVVIDKHFTTIAGGDGDENLIQYHIQGIREQINHEDDQNTIARLKERLVKLSGGLSVIHVGASSDVEIGEKKDRVDDAVCAVRSALQEGIVPGCGNAYVYAVVKNMKDNDKPGHRTVFNAVSQVMSKVSENAECENLEVDAITGIIKNKANKGIDAKNRAISEDMIGDGIIDPFKSIRVALENAVSVASMILTTNACVIKRTE